MLTIQPRTEVQLVRSQEYSSIPTIVTVPITESASARESVVNRYLLCPINPSRTGVLVQQHLEMNIIYPCSDCYNVHIRWLRIRYHLETHSNCCRTTVTRTSCRMDVDWTVLDAMHRATHNLGKPKIAKRGFHEPSTVQLRKLDETICRNFEHRVVRDVHKHNPRTSWALLEHLRDH